MDARAAARRPPVRERSRQRKAGSAAGGQWEGGKPRSASRGRLVARGLAALERPEAPYLVLLAGFALAGLALRLDRLGAQSLWFDEADVVMQARAPLGALLRNLGAAGQNGPLYTLFLHFWMALFGTGEVAVRLPSALAGAATIPLIYAAGRAIHGPKLGLYAAGIFTVAPYQHWYAQEAKMYALVVAATLASTLLFVLALRDDRAGSWLGYWAVTTLALYLHVTAALVMAAQMALFALLAVGGPSPRAGGGPRAPLRRRSARVSRRGLLALAALTLPYLPLAAWELRFVLGPTATWHPPAGVLDALRVTFTRFASGFKADPGTEARAQVLFGALAALGALPLGWRHAPWPAPALAPRRRALLLVTLVALPLVLFAALTTVKPLFSERYLIAIAPAFYLLAAGGILALERYARPLALLALAAILATAWVPLRDVNRAEAAQKEDWRTAYAQIARHAHPGDVLIVHPGYLATTRDYYRLQAVAGERLGEVPVVTIGAEFTDGTYDGRRLDLELQERTAGFERVWLLLSPDRLTAPSAPVDPADRVRDWYRYNGRLIYERELNGLWLGLYTYNGPFGSSYYPPPPVRLDLQLDDRLRLVGYGYDLPPGRSAVPPGGSIPLVLRWEFPGRQAGSFAIRWRLLDERGATVPGVGEVAPLLGGIPTPPWGERVGEIWDYHDLPLPAPLPPGRYRVAIECVARDRPDQPLPLAPAGGGEAVDAVPLGWVEVR